MPKLPRRLSIPVPLLTLMLGAAMAAVVGDSLFNCPARELADRLSETGHTVYAYNFVQPVSGMVNGLLNLMRGANTSDLGTSHGTEIPYVFGFSSDPSYLDTAQKKQAANYTIRYWGSFARSGNPNADGLPLWLTYGKNTPNYLELGEMFASKSAYRETFCQFWAAQPQ